MKSRTEAELKGVVPTVPGALVYLLRIRADCVSRRRAYCFVPARKPRCDEKLAPDGSNSRLRIETLTPELARQQSEVTDALDHDH